MKQPASERQPISESQPVSEPQPIVVECDLPQAPATVWRALTEKDLLGAWLLPNDMRAEVGAKFSFTDAERPRREQIECEVLRVEPNRTLQWRQTEEGGADTPAGCEVTSVVTIELIGTADGGTHLRLEHGDFAVAAGAGRTVAMLALRATCAAESDARAGAAAGPVGQSDVASVVGRAVVVPMPRRAAAKVRPSDADIAMSSFPPIVCLRRAA
jgi:uncharacterized protein YndB with AHSA1/START domain